MGKYSVSKNTVSNIFYHLSEGLTKEYYRQNFSGIYEIVKSCHTKFGEKRGEIDYSFCFLCQKNDAQM